MSFLSPYKGLPKSVYIIFFAQVINRFGDFVLPFLSFFLVNKLGLSYQEAGVAITLTSLSSIPGSFAGGKAADHFGRKKSYMVFQISAGASLFFCAFLKAPLPIIALICISSFFNGGVRPIVSAIITDVLPVEKRQIGFSLSYLGINLGVSIGPLVAGFLFNRYVPLIFIGNAVTTFLVTAMVFMNIEETLPVNADDKYMNDEEKPEEGSVFQALARRPRILVFLIINVILNIAYAQHSFSLPIMFGEIFGSSGASNYGLIISINAVTVITMTIFVTHATRKWNALSSIAAAGLLYAVGFGMITFIRSMPLFILSTFIWTIGEIMTVTNSGVYIANNTPQNYRARFNAASNLSWSVGASLSTLMISRYAERFGIEAVWPLAFFLGILGAVCMLMLRIKTEKAVAESGPTHDKYM